MEHFCFEQVGINTKLENRERNLNYQVGQLI